MVLNKVADNTNSVIGIIIALAVFFGVIESWRWSRRSVTGAL